MGMGGAFTALADDASGVVYNPGGLGFAPTLDLSANVTAFYERRTTYETVFGKRDFTETSRGSVASFFGALRKFKGGVLEDVAVGFAIHSPDAGLNNENILIENEPEATVRRFHRTASNRTNTLVGSVALAKRFFGRVGVGVALSYFDIDELEQIYQDIEQGPLRFPELPGVETFYRVTDNARYHLKVSGYEPTIGMRADLGAGVSVGAAYRKPTLLAQSYETSRERGQVITDAQGRVVSVAGTRDRALRGELVRSVSSRTEDAPFRAFPHEIRAGLAWAPTKSFAWSADAIFKGPAEANESTPALNRARLVNYASGVELRPFARLILRGGAFTNFDATANRDVSAHNQRGEYIDYLGVTGAFALRFKSSEYGAAFMWQNGKGEAQKVPGRNNRARSFMRLLGISATQIL